MDPAHVVNGDSVGGMFPDMGLPGPVIVWRDVLMEGPVPPGDPATVLRARAEFLAGSGWGWEGPEEIFASLAAADAALVAALDDGRETVLWFEHDLHDQLQLIQILARVADHPGRGALRMITLDRHPAHPVFRGMGQLTAPELAALWPSRRPLEPRAFALATRAWDAFRRPDRAELAALAGEPSADLPYLAAALARLLEEQPWAGAALGRSERQILRAVADGSHTWAEIFGATMQMEEAPYAGDSWVLRRIEALAAGERPLLASRGGRYELTAEGRAALAA